MKPLVGLSSTSPCTGSRKCALPGMMSRTALRCKVYRQEFDWLYQSPEGGQLKNQQPFSTPPPRGRVRWPSDLRCCLLQALTTQPPPPQRKSARFLPLMEQRNVMGTFSKRQIHSMIIIIHRHKKHMDINCCTLSLICLCECELFRTTWGIFYHALDDINCNVCVKMRCLIYKESWQRM